MEYLCPKCGGKMEAGDIINGCGLLAVDAAYWIPKGSRPIRLSWYHNRIKRIKDENGEFLMKTKRDFVIDKRPLDFQKFPAYICRNCKCGIFEYDN